MLNCFIIFYGVARNMVSSKNFSQISNYFKENKLSIAIKMLLNCFTGSKSKKKKDFFIVAFQAEISGMWVQIATCASCEGCLLSKNC